MSSHRLRDSFSYGPTAPATHWGLSFEGRSVNGLMKDWELATAILHVRSAVVANFQSFIMTRLHHRGPPCFLGLSTRPPRSLHPPRPSALRQAGSSARIGNTGTLSHGCESAAVLRSVSSSLAIPVSLPGRRFRGTGAGVGGAGRAREALQTPLRFRLRREGGTGAGAARVSLVAVTRALSHE